MTAHKILHEYLEDCCGTIHKARLAALMDVAAALQRSKNLTLTGMGRKLNSQAKIKHKIKKVDRLEGNKHLYQELNELYAGLSSYVFSLISQDKSIPVVVDLCYLQDDHAIQMLSAEIATKGRTIPLYRELFQEGELKGRASSFIENLVTCLPSERKVVVIMDAGFSVDWFKAIEAQGWYWVCRIRQGKSLKFSAQEDWINVRDFLGEIAEKTKNYNNVLLTREHKHLCRIITTRPKAGNNALKSAPSRQKNRKVASGAHVRSAKEPWILATNLPDTDKAVHVIKCYTKRMQIEESFRDIKSHQFGLSSRYVRTANVMRLAIKMLLAAIAQIVFWVIGIIGHSQGMQSFFQANTVKNKKVFSYFTLGQLIMEHDQLSKLKIDYDNLPEIIQNELTRVW